MLLLITSSREITRRIKFSIGKMRHKVWMSMICHFCSCFLTHKGVHKHLFYSQFYLPIFVSLQTNFMNPSGTTMIREVNYAWITLIDLEGLFFHILERFYVFHVLAGFFSLLLDFGILIWKSKSFVFRAHVQQIFGYFTPVSVWIEDWISVFLVWKTFARANSNLICFLSLPSQFSSQLSTESCKLDP